MKTLLSFSGFPLVVAEFFGTPKPKVDLVVNCPHAFFADDFLNFFPDIANIFQNTPPEVLWQYRELERDFGSFSLARSIAQKSAERGLFVAFLVVQCDRGILDANRVPSCAVRRVFDHQRYSAETAKLREMAQEIGKTILSFSKKNLSPDGFFLDCHSMWPSCQYVLPGDFEHPEHLTGYIKTLINPENQSRVRSLNFLVRDEGGRDIADAKRTSILVDALSRSGFPSKYDDPYFFQPRYQGFHYYSSFPGVSIDAPRQFLGKITSYDGLFPIWTEDFDRIDALSEALVNGIAETFSPSADLE